MRTPWADCKLRLTRNRPRRFRSASSSSIHCMGGSVTPRLTAGSAEDHHDNDRCQKSDRVSKGKTFGRLRFFGDVTAASLRQRHRQPAKSKNQTRRDPAYDALQHWCWEPKGQGFG